MTDKEFAIFEASFGAAIRSSAKGPERDAAIQRDEAFGDELREIQAKTRGGRAEVLKAVEALCVRYGWTRTPC